MCLSKIYIKDTGKDTLVVDNAASVMNDDGVITVSTLFGKEKKLEGYVINEVNLVENYILLKKGDKMGAQLSDSDIDQMKTVMTYLLKHNNEHIKDIKKWLKKAEDIGLNDVVKDLREVNQLSEEISGHFEATVKKLESYK